MFSVKSAAVAAMFVFGAATMGQSLVPGPDPAGPNNHYMFGTLRPGSPTLTALGLSGPHLLRMCGGSNPMVRAVSQQFGLPSDVAGQIEVLAVAYANDEFAPWHLTQPSFNGRHTRIEFVVQTSGGGSGFANNQVYGVDYMCSGTWPNPNVAGIGPFVVNNAKAAPGDVINALAYEHTPVVPIFFTISRQSAALLRSAHPTLFGSLNACDVLRSPPTGGGFATIVAAGTSPSIDLHQDDEITSLMIDRNGCAVIGLSHDSPSIVYQRPILSVGPPSAPTQNWPKKNMLLGFVPASAAALGVIPIDYDRTYGKLFAWADAPELGLPNEAPSGFAIDLADTWSDDPPDVQYFPPTLPLRDNPGDDYVSRHSMYVNGYDGGPGHRAFVDLGATFEVEVNHAGAGAYESLGWLLLMCPGSMIGRPWTEITSGGDTFTIPTNLAPWSASEPWGCVPLAGGLTGWPGLENLVVGAVDPQGGVVSIQAPTVVSDYVFFSLVMTNEQGVLHLRSSEHVWTTFQPAVADLFVVP
jgi:hypothetical protein